MIPEQQIWQKDGDFVYLEKNYGAERYFVDVQSSSDIKNHLKAIFDNFDELLYCQWNQGSNLPVSPKYGKVLTIRSRTQKMEGIELLKLVGEELANIGYERKKWQQFSYEHSDFS